MNLQKQEKQSITNERYLGTISEEDISNRKRLEYVQKFRETTKVDQRTKEEVKKIKSEEHRKEIEQNEKQKKLNQESQEQRLTKLKQRMEKAQQLATKKIQQIEQVQQSLNYSSSQILEETKNSKAEAKQIKEEAKKLVDETLEQVKENFRDLKEQEKAVIEGQIAVEIERENIQQLALASEVITQNIQNTQKENIQTQQLYETEALSAKEEYETNIAKEIEAQEEKSKLIEKTEYDTLVANEIQKQAEIQEQENIRIRFEDHSDDSELVYEDSIQTIEEHEQAVEKVIDDIEQLENSEDEIEQDRFHSEVIVSDYKAQLEERLGLRPKEEDDSDENLELPLDLYDDNLELPDDLTESEEELQIPLELVDVDDSGLYAEIGIQQRTLYKLQSELLEQQSEYRRQQDEIQQHLANMDFNRGLNMDYEENVLELSLQLEQEQLQLENELAEAKALMEQNEQLLLDGNY